MLLTLTAVAALADGSGVSWARVDAQATAERLPLGRAGDQELEPGPARQRFDLRFGRTAGHHPHLGPARARHDVHAFPARPVHRRRSRDRPAATGSSAPPLARLFSSWMGSSNRGLPLDRVPRGALRDHPAARRVPVGQGHELETRARRHATRRRRGDARSHQHLGSLGNVGDHQRGSARPAPPCAPRWTPPLRPLPDARPRSTSAFGRTERRASKRSTVTVPSAISAEKREQHVDLAPRRTTRERIFVGQARHRPTSGARRRRAGVEISGSCRVLKRRFVDLRPRRGNRRLVATRGRSVDARHVTQILRDAIARARARRP